jgi:hypothetical protein
VVNPTENASKHIYRLGKIYDVPNESDTSGMYSIEFEDDKTIGQVEPKHIHEVTQGETIRTSPHVEYDTTNIENTRSCIYGHKERYARVSKHTNTNP